MSDRITPAVIPNTHYSATCVECSKQIQLPREILWHITGEPTGQTTLYQAIAYPCPHCRQIQTLLIRDFESHRTTAAKSSLKQRAYGLLRCEEATCTFAVPLYGLWVPETAEQEEAAGTKPGYGGG